MCHIFHFLCLLIRLCDFVQYAIEQPIDPNISEQKIMLAFYLSAPEVENDRRAKNTMNGMRKSMREGRWVSTAPFGYKNARDANNKPILVQNEKAPIVRQVFEMFATGGYHIDELRKEASKLGLKLTKNPFWTLLRNPVYIGKIKIKTYLHEPEEIVQGLHEPIINEDLFNKVQQILLGKKKIMAKKTKARDEFPLRGVLVCHLCGRNLTGSSSKGNGGKYFYYHCQGDCTERYKSDIIHATFEDWLNTITIKPELAQLYSAVLEDVYKINEGDRETEIKRIENKITESNEMENKAGNKLVNDEIDKDTFKRLKDSYVEERFKLQIRVDELKNTESGFIEHCRYSLSMLSNLQLYYKTANLEGKQRLLGAIFPEKLIFDRNSYRTKECSELLDLLCIQDKGSRGSKKKQIVDFNDLFFRVVSLGIEPRSKV